jgi:GABA permease
MAKSIDTGENAGLQHSLKQRHMTLIALGGVIGAGLFIGSGVLIHETGPAAVISFLLAGGLAILVMRMLGEMAAAKPAVGSFYEYARAALGDRAGFAIGWMYWYFWVIVVAVEAVAGAALIQHWLPQVPLWTLSLALMLTLTLTNLASVKSYGEFEYWFSSIKVAAIIVFIVLGLSFVLGAWPDQSADVSNLTAHGGFAPHGVLPVLAAVVPAVAFFTGAEIATIAAAESAEPRKAVARATNSVILRVLIFYVGSVFLVVTVRPWDSQAVLESPYVGALQAMGISAAAEIMRVIVLTAVLSALNSGLYTASRVIFALTRHHDAPQGFLKLNRRGVPVRAILLGTVLGYVSVVMAYVSPDQVFSFLIHSYGAVALFVYTLIALSQLRLRRRLEREDPDSLVLKMWLFPYLSWFTVAAMVTVTLAMGILPETRIDFALSLVTLVAILIAYEVRKRRCPAAGVTPSAGSTGGASTADLAAGVPAGLAAPSGPSSNGAHSEVAADAKR